MPEQRSGVDRRMGSTIPPDAPHFSVEGLAERWNVSRRVVYEMVRAGDLPAVRIGRKRTIRVTGEAVRDYELRNRESGQSGAPARPEAVPTDAAGA